MPKQILKYNIHQMKINLIANVSSRVEQKCVDVKLWVAIAIHNFK